MSCAPQASQFGDFLSLALNRKLLGPIFFARAWNAIELSGRPAVLQSGFSVEFGLDPVKLTFMPVVPQLSPHCRLRSGSLDIAPEGILGIEVGCRLDVGPAREG